MPHSSDQPEQSGQHDLCSEWLTAARNLLESLSTAEQGIEATLRRREISASDSPAIDFLAERVDGGFAWLEKTLSTAHVEASIELRAALGVLRNLAFALRRLSTGEDSSGLRRSCDALLDQGRLHVEAAARAVDEAEERSS